MEQAALEQATPARTQPARPDARQPAMWEQAFRTGLYMGLILAGLNIVNWLAGLSAGGAFADQVLGGIFVNQTVLDLAFAATCGLFLARLALYFVAGHRVAARTGRPISGALVGLVVGAVDGVSGLVITLLGVALFPMYTLTSGYGGAAQPVGNAVLLGVVETLVLAAIGAAVGIVGGGTIESDRYPRAA